MLRLIQLLALLCLMNAAGLSYAQGYERIIALAPHTVELLFSMGAGERIIATTQFADYPEQAKNIQRVGGYHGLDIEAILALKPDLIIAWEGGNKEQDILRLEELGLNVVRGKTETLDRLGPHIRELGTLLSIENKADALASEFEAALAQRRAQYAQEEPVAFFYQLWLEPLRTLTANSWVNDTLTVCGGENVFAEHAMSDYPQVSMESVLLKQPEAIVVPSHHGDVIATGEMWLNWPEVPAVKNAHIFYIDGDILHRFSLRLLEGIDAVCEAFDQVRAQRVKVSEEDRKLTQEAN